MDIKELLEPLARYLEFLIDYSQFHGMEKYTRLGSISPSLLLFCVFGIFLAYLISSTKAQQHYDVLFQPKISSEKNEQTSVSSSSANEHSQEPVSKYAVARFMLLSLVGAFLLHGFLIVYSEIFNVPKIYSVKDTLNAVFAYNAFYHPLNALAKRILLRMTALKSLGKGADALNLVLYVVLLVVYAWLIIYSLYPLAAVHGASSWSMAPPCLAFLLFVMTLLWLFFRILGISVKSVFKQVLHEMDNNINSHITK